MSEWSDLESRFLHPSPSSSPIQPLSAPFPTPTDSPRRALGLRRLQWQAHEANQPSIRLAQRMGFKPEGIVRKQRIAPTGTEEGREGDGGATGSRSSWAGGITFEDWEDEEFSRGINKQVARR